MPIPFIHINFAVRDDGRMQSDDGKALPISCPRDWRRVHRLRARYHAVAVGAKTWQADQPRLDVRREHLGSPPRRQPALVLFAGRGDVKVEDSTRRIFVVGRQDPRQAGIVFVSALGRRLRRPLERLFDHGIQSMLVEGGATLLRSFVEQGLFDRVTAYVPTSRRETAVHAVSRVLPELPSLEYKELGQGLLLSTGRVRQSLIHTFEARILG